MLREATLVAEPQPLRDRDDRFVASPQRLACRADAALHPVGAWTEGKHAVERPLQLPRRHAAVLRQTGNRGEAGELGAEGCQCGDESAADRARRGDAAAAAERAHHADHPAAAVEERILVGLIPVGQPDLVEPEVDVTDQRLPRLDHRPVVGSVVGGEGAGGEVLVGGTEHLLVVMQPDVRQDAAAEEERLAGEVLGEEEHVAESVEGAMEVALGGDLREKPLLLGRPVALCRRLLPGSCRHPCLPAPCRRLPPCHTGPVCACVVCDKVGNAHTGHERRLRDSRRRPARSSTRWAQAMPSPLRS
jgi:hypothetical protein